MTAMMQPVAGSRLEHLFSDEGQAELHALAREGETLMPGIVAYARRCHLARLRDVEPLPDAAAEAVYETKGYNDLDGVLCRLLAVLEAALDGAMGNNNYGPHDFTSD